MFVISHAEWPLSPLVMDCDANLLQQLTTSLLSWKDRKKVLFLSHPSLSSSSFFPASLPSSILCFRFPLSHFKVFLIPSSFLFSLHSRSLSFHLPAIFFPFLQPFFFLYMYFFLLHFFSGALFLPLQLTFSSFHINLLSFSPLFIIFISDFLFNMLTSFFP